MPHNTVKRTGVPINAKLSRIPIPKCTIEKTSEKKSVKINKARPVPDFNKLHKKWQEQFEEGVSKTRKPCTVPRESPKHVVKSVKKPDGLNESNQLAKRALRTTSLYSRRPQKQTQQSLSSRATGRQPVSQPPAIQEEFRADPTSLARILAKDAADDPNTQQQPPTKRASIYDRLSVRQKYSLYDKRDQESMAMAFMFNNRTPLRLLDNIPDIENRSPSMDSPKDIYQSAKKSAKRSFLKTSDKMKFMENSIKKRVTWAQKLSESPSGNDKVKVQLSFENEVDTSLLMKLEEAEKKLCAELMVDSPSDKTFTIKKSNDDGDENECINLSRPITDYNALLSNSNANDSVCGLLSEMNINSQKKCEVSAYQLDDQNAASPLLSSKVSQKLSRLQNKTKQNKEPLESSPNVHPALKIGHGNTLKTVSEEANEDEIRKLNELISIDRLLDITVDSNKLGSPITPWQDIETSPELVKTINQIDGQIEKSRRRSAMLRNQLSPTIELQSKLKEILQQECELEQEKLNIEEKLERIRTCEIKSLCSTNVHDDNSLLTVTVLAGHNEDENNGDAKDLDNNTSITFSPKLPPLTDVNNCVLRAVSTGKYETCRLRPKKRESINLMAFSPTLTLVEEDREAKLLQPLDSDSSQSYESLKNLPTATPDRMSHNRNQNNTSATYDDLTSPTTITELSSSPSNSSSKIEDVMMDTSNKYSSNILRSQSHLIAQLDSIHQGHTASYNQLLIQSLSSTSHIMPTNIVAPLSAFAVANECLTPVARKVGSTISIRSVYNTPVPEKSRTLEVGKSPQEKNNSPHLNTSTCCSTASICIATPDSNTFINSVQGKGIVSEYPVVVSTRQRPSAEFNTPELFCSFKDRQKHADITFQSMPERYREALLDDEVSVYMCRSSMSPVLRRQRDLHDPLAFTLLYGDDSHFMPIQEVRETVVVDESAFHILTS